MHGAELRETPPTVFNFIFEMELLAGAFDESVVPLLGCKVLAKTGQVENGDARAVFAQAGGGADHQRRLAHLASGEDVADFSGLQSAVESLVGAAFDVGGRIPAKGSADDKKTGR